MDEVKLIDGQLMSLEEVFLKFRPLIASLSNKLLKTAYKFGLDFDDLFGYGSEGLLKAYRKFDSEKGFKFMTYAFPLVRGEIQRRIRDYGGLVKFSRAEKSLAKEIYRSEMQDLSVAEICKRTGRKEAEVLSALSILNHPTISIDKKLNDDDEKGINLGDQIGVYSDFSTVDVDDFLSTLSPRLRKVVTLTMNDKTQKEVGEEIGCSQVQVSRYLKKVSELYKQYLTEGETMKQIRLRIIDLIDQHGDTFEKCKGCPICNEIMQLRRKLERDPADKYQSILAKGEDMTKSDLAFLMENQVTHKVIMNALGMPSQEYWTLIQNLGLGKKGKHMGKLTLEMYKDLKEQGLSDKEIAVRVGITSQYVSQLKKKWDKSPEQPDTDAKQPVTAVQMETLPKIQPSEKESKSVEYERLIAALRNDLNDINTQLDEKDELIRNLEATIAKYVNVNAACEDVENELDGLQDDNNCLRHALSKMQDENAILEIENNALKQLVKLWI